MFHGWYWDGKMADMPRNSDESPSRALTATLDGGRQSLVARPAESEKVTINLGFVDLGQIDLLVSESFYANRTDFIRTAIRNQLTAQAEALKQVTSRRMLVLGAQHFSAADLQAVRTAGEQLHIRVLGLASIGAEVSPELALATIASVSVLGSLQASREVRLALAARIL